MIIHFNTKTPIYYPLPGAPASCNATVPTCGMPCTVPIICSPVCTETGLLGPILCTVREFFELFPYNAAGHWSAATGWTFDMVGCRLATVAFLKIEQSRGNDFGSLKLTKYADLWALLALVVGSDFVMPLFLLPIINSEKNGTYKKITKEQYKQSWVYLVIGAVSATTWMYAICNWAMTYNPISIENFMAHSLVSPWGFRSVLEMTILYIPVCLVAIPQIEFQTHYTFGPKRNIFSFIVAIIFSILWYYVGFHVVAMATTMFLFFRDYPNLETGDTAVSAADAKKDKKKK